MYQVYILQSQTDYRYYVGSCQNVIERIKLHNSGRVKSTKRHLPWRVVYLEKFKTRKEAVKRERQIKSWKKRRAIEKLIKNL